MSKLAREIMVSRDGVTIDGEPLPWFIALGVFFDVPAWGEAA